MQIPHSKQYLSRLASKSFSMSSLEIVGFAVPKSSASLILGFPTNIKVYKRKDFEETDKKTMF